MSKNLTQDDMDVVDELAHGETSSRNGNDGGLTLKHIDYDDLPDLRGEQDCTGADLTSEQCFWLRLIHRLGATKGDLYDYTTLSRETINHHITDACDCDNPSLSRQTAEFMRGPISRTECFRMRVLDRFGWRNQRIGSRFAVTRKTASRHINGRCNCDIQQPNEIYGVTEHECDLFRYALRNGLETGGEYSEGTVKKHAYGHCDHIGDEEPVNPY